MPLHTHPRGREARSGHSLGQRARRLTTPRRPTGRRQGTRPQGAAARLRLCLSVSPPPRHSRMGTDPELAGREPHRGPAGGRRDTAGGWRRTMADQTRRHHQHHHGPARRARPSIPTPRGHAQRPLAVGGSSRRGRPRAPRPGPQHELSSSLFSLGQRPRASTRGGGTVSSRRGLSSQQPCKVTPSRWTPGRCTHTHGD